MFSFGNSRPEMSARWRNSVRLALVRPLKLAAFCTTSNKWMSTGSLLGSSSLPNPIYRGSGTPHGARLNSHEMTIQNGFKPTQSCLPMEEPACAEHKSGPRRAVAGIAQPPRPMATKLRTLQRPGGKRGQRRCSHARGLLAARGTFHSPDQRGDSRAGCALTKFFDSMLPERRASSGAGGTFDSSIAAALSNSSAVLRIMSMRQGSSDWTAQFRRYPARAKSISERMSLRGSFLLIWQ